MERTPKRFINMRAQSKRGSSQNKLRNTLYKKGIERVKQAISAGYYIEAIMILESMITDRVVSVIEVLHKDDDTSWKLNSFGSTVYALNKLTYDLNCRTAENEDLIKSLRQWKSLRNTAAHQFVFVQHNRFGQYDDLPKRYHTMKKTAQQGVHLMRAVDRLTRNMKETISNR